MISEQLQHNMEHKSTIFYSRRLHTLAFWRCDYFTLFHSTIIFSSISRLLEEHRSLEFWFRNINHLSHSCCNYSLYSTATYVIFSMIYMYQKNIFHTFPKSALDIVILYSWLALVLHTRVSSDGLTANMEMTWFAMADCGSGHWLSTGTLISRLFLYPSLSSDFSNRCTTPAPPEQTKPLEKAAMLVTFGRKSWLELLSGIAAIVPDLSYKNNLKFGVLEKMKITRSWQKKIERKDAEKM